MRTHVCAPTSSGSIEPPPSPLSSSRECKHFSSLWLLNLVTRAPTTNCRALIPAHALHHHHL